MKSSFSLIAFRARRGSVLWWVVGGIALVVAILWLRSLSKEETTQRATRATNQMTDPATMLEQYFLLAAKKYGPDNDWQALLRFYSADDLRWMDQNVDALAAMSPWMREHPDKASDDAAKRYAAASLLGNFGNEAHNTVVTTPTVVAAHALAHVHAPGDIATMREVFLEDNGGEWKILRFLGRRDTEPFMRAVVAAKENAGTPLSSEEQNFKADPKAYAEAARARLLAQVDMKP